MNTTNRLWHVVAAVGLALLAVLLTTFYVTNYKHHVQHGESQVTVLVAVEGHSCRHPGRRAHVGHVATRRAVARRQVVPGAISSPDQVRDLIATEPTFAGEQVTARRFGTPAERGVRAQIKGTQRAVQVAGDANQVLAGTLRQGDHVDIVGAWATSRTTAHGVARRSSATFSCSRPRRRPRAARRARAARTAVSRAAPDDGRRVAEARVDPCARQGLALRDSSVGRRGQQPALARDGRHDAQGRSW